MKTAGDVLKEIREFNRMKIHDMAKVLGVTPGTEKQYERSNRRMVISQLDKLYWKCMVPDDLAEAFIEGVLDYIDFEHELTVGEMHVLRRLVRDLYASQFARYDVLINALRDAFLFKKEWRTNNGI